ncbi:adenylate/guanylate cyclase domain-containing protein [Microvirga zambiensis]|uniref:adenylate/guanylate cyclase domain-containing protein n=1 Tax=Microvirga zambiensis TaxID=1402137 RepID=UPI00191DF536|nr:adenylate/guanylate cyclase domain-containing protein [Microvirga zambiensis]
MTEKLKRRLTTVLCADVEGYSRLMEVDEAGTLTTLRRYRDAMAALVSRHDGRIVNTWGDAVIAEFPSVVEAVQCAVETQRELSGQDPHLPEAQRMRFRIGINLGDVMVDGADIYGDGVNVAARLQEMAEPGGILISGPVYDQVRNKLTVGFDYLGERQVKNVASPVTSYRVTLGSRPVDQVGTERDGARAPSSIATVPLREKADARTSAPGISNLLAGMPRPLRAAILISAFLFLINLFSGFHEIWFHWPALSILFIALLLVGLRRKPEERDRTGRR